VLLLAWGPLTFAAAYLVVVATQFKQLIVTNYLNADAASAPVIGQLYSSGPPHREVVLGHMAWYSTLIYELATRGLPAHRAIWEATPYALALISVALIAWGLWRIAGGWAAAIGATLLVCASPRTLDWLFWLNDHALTWFSLALVAALLVLLQDGSAGARRTAWGWRAVAIVLVGAIVGANAASDLLLIWTVLLPLLLAAVGAWALCPGRATLRAMGLTFLALGAIVVGDLLTHTLMRQDGIRAPANLPQNVLAGGEAVASNFKLWWQSIVVLGDGNFFGQSLGFTSALQLVCGVLALFTVVVFAPRVAWRELGQALRLRRGMEVGSDGGGEAGRRRGGEAGRRDGTATSERAPREAVWLAWCIFWVSSAALLTFSFITSSTPTEIESDRYLVGLILRSRRARAAGRAARGLVASGGNRRRGSVRVHRHRHPARRPGHLQRHAAQQSRAW